MAFRKSPNASICFARYGSSGPGRDECPSSGQATSAAPVGGRMKKRDLFAELILGVDEMAAQREGKNTRRNHTVEDTSVPDLGKPEVVTLEAKLHTSPSD